MLDDHEKFPVRVKRSSGIPYENSGESVDSSRLGRHIDCAKSDVHGVILWWDDIGSIGWVGCWCLSFLRIVTALFVV